MRAKWLIAFWMFTASSAADGNRTCETHGTYERQTTVSVDLSNLLHGYQRRHVENPARFTWNNWSRQTGKSFSSTLRRIVRGMMRKRNQILLSAGATQSRELMMKARDHLEAMRIAASNVSEGPEEVFEGIKYNQLEIAIPELGPGGKPLRIIGLPANPRTARGFTGDLLLDEFAMHQHDQAIYSAAFPTVSRGGGEMDVCSTPQGRQNAFYRLGQNDLFSRTTVTIHDAIADGCPQNAEELRRGCPDEDTWRQEFLCEFVDEATAFLTYEQIGECEKGDLPLTIDVAELRQHRGDVVVGMDVGRKKDLTVIWAFETLGGVMYSLGMQIHQGVSFSEQEEHLYAVLAQRCVRRCAIDASGLGSQLAERAVERFGTHMVEPCVLSQTFKEQIANRMRNRFIDKLIRIPVDEKVRNDLHSVTKTVTAAGNVRLMAPRDEGSHADRFWAAALACHAAGEDLGPVDCVLPDANDGAAGLRDV